MLAPKRRHYARCLERRARFADDTVQVITGTRAHEQGTSQGRMERRRTSNTLHGKCAKATVPTPCVQPPSHQAPGVPLYRGRMKERQASQHTVWQMRQSHSAHSLPSNPAANTRQVQSCPTPAWLAESGRPEPQPTHTNYKAWQAVYMPHMPPHLITSSSHAMNAPTHIHECHPSLTWTHPRNSMNATPASQTQCVAHHDMMHRNKRSNM
jgi:hypothetical protein